MKFRAFRPAAFSFAVGVLSVLFLSGLNHIVEPVPVDPRPLYDFFFNHSFIEWLTLGVFFPCLAVLVNRPVYYPVVQRGGKHLT